MSMGGLLKMEVDRRLTYALDKNFNFLKKNLLRLLHISSILKACLSSSFITSSSLAQLSAAFSVLLAAITKFDTSIFQQNKPSQRVTFAGQFWAWLENFLLAQN